MRDYARNNFGGQPGDAAGLVPKLGPWDYYAIGWGYRRVPGANRPEAERPVLDSLARLQDAQPWLRFGNPDGIDPRTQTEALGDDPVRSEEHTSELQSQSNLVCRLLLEKKKKIINACGAIPLYRRQHDTETID